MIKIAGSNGEEFTYNPDFFTPSDIADAKRIILGYGAAETPDRWHIETNWNIKLFKSKNFITQHSVVLDWGSGIGRLSKAMIDEFGCRVVGVDINPTMREYSVDYVNSDKFTPMSVEEFRNNDSIQFSNVISVWTLQHSVTVVEDLELIQSRLLPDAEVFIFEAAERCVPIMALENGHTWAIIRGSSNFHTADQLFTIKEHGAFPARLNIPENDRSWWAFFKNKKRKSV